MRENDRDRWKTIHICRLGGRTKEGEEEGKGMGKEEGGKKERKVERRERQNNVMKKDGGKEEARKKGGNDREEWRW